MHAQYYGAVGAILYNDPADYAPFGITPDQVYDQNGICLQVVHNEDLHILQMVIH